MKSITIFEGPDGSGKTTAALHFAEATGARYVHHGSYKRMSTGLARLYLESMLPALMGYQDIVLDRCWLSEVPYGDAYRGGLDRLGLPACRMLERIAMRCGAVVVRCLPGYDVVQKNFRSRTDSEMLDNDTQLLEVYRHYDAPYFKTALPVLDYDYIINGDSIYPLAAEIDDLRMHKHDIDVKSAGNIDAPYVIVGEPITDHTNDDCLIRFPFVSFNQESGSWWLTEELITHNVNEADLFWIDADEDLGIIHDLEPSQVFAISHAAVAELYRNKIQATAITRPETHRRFKSVFTYPLFNHLGETA